MSRNSTRPLLAPIIQERGFGIRGQNFAALSAKVFVPMLNRSFARRFTTVFANTAINLFLCA
jgi:hypothetical protein